MKSKGWIVGLTLMLLQGAAAAQVSNEQAWCNNLGLAFHQVTSWREQGKTIKESFEIMARAHRQTTETSTSMRQEVVKTLQTIMMGVVIHVYKHPMYGVFGPEMNRTAAQAQCERVGVEQFMKDIDTEMRKLVSQK